mgnify:FL=1|tara:strand:+ start:847 stop:1110 length:264 start_codon:yes stop_codon:yes gene_type:complete
MNHKAIYALYSKVKYINDELGCFDATGNKIEIDEDKVKKWKDPDQYKIDRENSYPSIKDQLDEIYHKGIDEWKKTIKATKDKYPKGT